jgi:hypothetical protein
MVKKGSELPIDEMEIARRRDELAKRMLNTPPQPLKPKAEDGNAKKRAKTNQPSASPLNARTSPGSSKT